ncbi:SPT3 Dosage dependent suppressor of Ty-induced promoter mutations-like protein [Modicella reniformis]|uniref:SPT3 Dosage dependent suppressor of Ty-induced promoter mutations-like protein n=1 Tax=Modicella reniformis TaxID=1440133 RepID=A0A9P6MI19_9FUNG|nr:SPT3 Dosage dependent suppressor of Ty-induced promoter mutations-like protein [Modicella reniformis]
MSGYRLEARIIQKKDQLDELSTTGSIIPTPIVEEVRTGQQFLIKLHLLRNGNAGPGSHMPVRFPSLRVGRRVAINTAGEPRTESEPLTLEIGVHLAKSGQARKGACAKCCHKYGPQSAILVLLDPLSPSATEPSTYAHIDTTTGSITMLAKVICSSTDHGERGNKDRYIFEFKLKRSSSMPTRSTHFATSSSSSSETPEEEGETLSNCFTHPIMCSGHHKAKRAYPNQRPAKVKVGPTPKTKTIKRHKSAPNIIMPPMGSHHLEVFSGTGPMVTHNNSGFPSAIGFMPDHLSQVPILEPYATRSNGTDLRSGNGQPFVSSADSSSEAISQPPTPQYPRVIEVRPDHGPIRKKTDVILRGLSFREGMVPYFGCLPALDVIVETSNLIVCKTPESSAAGTVPISIYDNMGNSFSQLGHFTYTDDSESELLILQMQLRLAHRALEYLHNRATGQRENAVDILKNIPGLTTSPQPGNMLMADGGLTPMDFDTPRLSLAQVEEGILDTLNYIPRDVDISLQLEDGSNLLHLSIILDFNRLSFRLVEEGCDIEAQDCYSMTPLMYAVLKGNEAIARHLIIAGATSSGARTPQEFYANLPREAEQTLAMFLLLSVSCTRFFNPVLPLSAFDWYAAEEEADMDGVYPQEDEERDDEGESEVWGSQDESDENSSTNIPTTMTARSMTTLNSEDEVTILANETQGVLVNHGIPSLDQQALPSIGKEVNFIMADTASERQQQQQYRRRNSTETNASVNPESGYHSGLFSEVQEHLSRLQMAPLPSEGVKMEVLFKKLSQTVPPAAPLDARPQSIAHASMPLELFRTGDSFTLEIRLTAPSSSSSSSSTSLSSPSTSTEYSPIPNQYVGLRFPHEMIKRTMGNSAYILTEKTYILKVAIELGDLSVPIDQFVQTSDGCHYNGKEFYVPGGLSSSSLPSSLSPAPVTSQQSTVNNFGVLELHDGVCQLKAKVNCSSLHHLVQRERARQAEVQQQQCNSIESEGTDPPQRSLALTDLVDPGFVFKFELIHPTLGGVVAAYETKPILFQSYSRGSY